jgi:hypothetical protein
MSEILAILLIVAVVVVGMFFLKLLVDVGLALLFTWAQTIPTNVDYKAK